MGLGLQQTSDCVWMTSVIGSTSIGSLTMMQTLRQPAAICLSVCRLRNVKFLTKRQSIRGLTEVLTSCLGLERVVITRGRLIALRFREWTYVSHRAGMTARSWHIHCRVFFNRCQTKSYHRERTACDNIIEQSMVISRQPRAVVADSHCED